MDHTTIVSIEIFFISLVTILGFFITKGKSLGGFGPHTTSALLILLTISITAILFLECRLDAQFFSNLAFAVIGFAGGLFTHARSNQQAQSNASQTTKQSDAI